MKNPLSTEALTKANKDHDQSVDFKKGNEGTCIKTC